MHVATGGRQNENAISVNKLWVNTNSVIKPGLLSDVVFCHVVQSINFSCVSNPDSHGKVAKANLATPWRVAAQRFNSQHRLAASIDFVVRHAVWIRTIATGQMHQIHIREFACVVDGPPSPANRI